VARVRERRGAYRVFVGQAEGKRPLEHIGVVWRIILKWIFNKWNGNMEWIYLSQDRDRWRAVVNEILNPWVPQNTASFLNI
jgi:hypothetical protein